MPNLYEGHNDHSKWKDKSWILSEAFVKTPTTRGAAGTEVQGRTVWVGHEIHGKEAILIQKLGIWYISAPGI